MIERGDLGSVAHDQFSHEELIVEEDISSGCHVRYDVYIVV